MEIDEAHIAGRERNKLAARWEHAGTGEARKTSMRGVTVRTATNRVTERVVRGAAAFSEGGAS